jgi:hypothetical protein
MPFARDLMGTRKRAWVAVIISRMPERSEGRMPRWQLAAPQRR